jgi:hypothetical protein
MNQENLAFLQNRLKYLGFGENTILNNEMEAMILREPASFELYTEAFFDEETKLEAKLYFRRSEDSDRYSFLKYETLLRHHQDQGRDKTQTFYIYKGAGVTLKEAFNLLQGRAVYKALLNKRAEKYFAWIQLNFEAKDLNDNYRLKYFRSQNRFDLEKILQKYPIRELQSEELRAAMIKSLRRGNLHLVTFVKPTRTEKVFIQADPEFKQVQIFTMATRVAQKAAAMRSLGDDVDPGQGDGDPVSEAALEEETDP